MPQYLCIMKPLPSYWTYDRFLRQWDNTELRPVMAGSVRPPYELTTPANIMDSTVSADILDAANQTIPLRERPFLSAAVWSGNPQG